MNATASAIGVEPRLEPEDRLRADLYALFARLLVAPADAELLRLIGTSPLLDHAVPDSPFVIAWARLGAASRVMDPAASADEFDALFGGIGHSEISLFASHYVGGGAPGAGTGFLVDLRADLAQRGFGRKTGENLPEDHIAAILETMRLMIESGETVSEQRAFFDAFVASWTTACCTAIAHARLANFYRSVAESLREFLAVEGQSFEIG